MADEPTEETQAEEEAGGSMMYYVIGILVVVAIGVGVFVLRPKSTAPQPAVVETPLVATPTPGPITGLACDRQYYNPVIGFTKYYLSVDGVDLAPATNVDCEFTVKVGSNIVATASAQGELTPARDRNGQTFKCTTQALELTPKVTSVVDVIVKNNMNVSNICTASFVFP